MLPPQGGQRVPVLGVGFQQPVGPAEGEQHVGRAVRPPEPLANVPGVRSGLSGQKGEKIEVEQRRGEKLGGVLAVPVAQQRAGIAGGRLEEERVQNARSWSGGAVSSCRRRLSYSRSISRRSASLTCAGA